MLTHPSCFTLTPTITSLSPTHTHCSLHSSRIMKKKRDEVKNKLVETQKELLKVLKQKDGVQKDLEEAQTERDEVIKDRDKLKRERQKAQRERDTFMSKMMVEKNRRKQCECEVNNLKKDIVNLKLALAESTARENEYEKSVFMHNRKVQLAKIALQEKQTVSITLTTTLSQSRFNTILT